MIANLPTKSNLQISDIQTTSDLLVDRGGLFPFLRYMKETCVLHALATPLHKFRKGKKGISVPSCLFQTLAFLADGSSRHLSRFDELKRDPGYAALLEIPEGELMSSDQIERLFAKFPKYLWSVFRKILRRMFATQLAHIRPQTVTLFLDTMVLDNDDAVNRQGVEPTYKNVKGFQPLQLIWNHQVIDAQFRGGKKHGNHGETAGNMIEKAVKVVREVLGYEVGIVVRMDGGFFDGKLFEWLDINNVGFVCSGRLSKTVKDFAEKQTVWQELHTDKQSWSYVEFGNRCSNWDRFYRAIYLKPRFEGEQALLEFARPDRVIYTNMGAYPLLFKRLPEKIREQMFQVEALIMEHHAKGADELVHRGLKNFGFEQLPFKKYGANQAMYYLMVIAYNLLQWYKQDILIPLGLSKKGSYAEGIRRQIFDVAAKIVKSGRQVVMKVTTAAMERLRLKDMWERCWSPPRLLI